MKSQTVQMKTFSGIMEMCKVKWALF